MRPGWIIIILGIALASLPAGGAEAADPSGELVGTEADTVKASLARRDLLQKTFDENVVSTWLRPWIEKREEWFEGHGLELTLSYDSLIQASPHDGGLMAGAGESAISGNWGMLGPQRGRPVDLRFRIRNRHAYGGRAPSELKGDIGAFWGTSDGFTDAGFEVPNFYLSQRYLGQNLELRYGQMVIDSQFDRHALRGAKQSFLNQAFSSNPAVAFPRFGTGITLQWQGKNGVDVTAGFSSVQGTRTGDQVDFDWDSDDLFGAIQIGKDFSGWNGDPARWQILAWSADGIEEANLESGKGFSVTLEQKFEEQKIRCFARIAHASGGATDVSNLAVIGMGRDCREADLFGIAIGAGQANEVDRDWQGVVECFYRWQVEPQFHLTPDLQVLVGDGFDGSGELRTILGFRGSLSF
jgi:hypothetical protein